jgi:hypothetical protein
MTVLKIIQRYRDPAIWLMVLVVLFFMDMNGPSLCLFRWLGFHSCPGCGLGHSMHEALHGNWMSSVEYHILGLPAILLLLIHIAISIYSITKTNYQLHGSKNAYDAAGTSAR